MQRKNTTSNPDLWVRLASQDYVAVAQERLRWPRPAPGKFVVVHSDERISLPPQTEVVQMTLEQWASAFNDYVARGYVGPSAPRRGQASANVARGFAGRYGLLQEGTSMREKLFYDQQNRLREFLDASEAGGAAEYLNRVKPPVTVAAEIESHRGGNRLVFVPRDLLSGFWLIALRAATLDAKPLRVCALLGCDKPLTGTARNAFCCAAHRAAAFKNDHAKDKRKLRERLKRKGVSQTDIETFINLL